MEDVEQKVVALLPCPFCGECERIWPQNGDTPMLDGWRIMIWCEKCGCRSGEYTTEHEAIAAWNTRTPSAKLAEVERGWLPIEGAPSGREFLGGYWWRGEWLSNACKLRERPSGEKVIESRAGWRFHATHYQELPAPPLTPSAAIERAGE